MTYTKQTYPRRIFGAWILLARNAKQKSSEGRRVGIILTLRCACAFSISLALSFEYIRDEREKVCWRAGVLGGARFTRGHKTFTLPPTHTISRAHKDSENFPFKWHLLAPPAAPLRLRLRPFAKLNGSNKSQSNTRTDSCERRIRHRPSHGANWPTDGLMGRNIVGGLFVCWCQNTCKQAFCLLRHIAAAANKRVTFLLRNAYVALSFHSVSFVTAFITIFKGWKKSRTKARCSALSTHGSLRLWQRVTTLKRDPSQQRCRVVILCQRQGKFPAWCFAVHVCVTRQTSQGRVEKWPEPVKMRSLYSVFKPFRRKIHASMSTIRRENRYLTGSAKNF